MRRTCRCSLEAALALGLLLPAVPAVAALPYYALPVAGRIEHVRLTPGDIVIEAKLDTGARTSSLDATNMQRLIRDDADWVAFDIVGNDGRNVRIERPVVRIAKIKSALGTDKDRPVITLGVCIGKVYRITEVNLVDRSNLTAPLLIGRRFLQGRLLVNVNRRNLLEPACPRKTVP